MIKAELRVPPIKLAEGAVYWLAGPLTILSKLVHKNSRNLVLSNLFFYPFIFIIKHNWKLKINFSIQFSRRGPSTAHNSVIMMMRNEASFYKEKQRLGSWSPLSSWS